MSSLARILLGLCAAALALVGPAHAWYGTVTFYHHVHWDGPDFPWGITQTNRCYNLSCFNKRAGSIQWDGIKEAGDVNGKSYMVFFTEPNCEGQAYWWPVDADQPSDLTANGLDKKISSFTVWEKSKKITNGYDTPCPWGTT